MFVGQNSGSLLDDGIHNPENKIKEKEQAVSPPDDWISKKVDHCTLHWKELTLLNKTENVQDTHRCVEFHIRLIYPEVDRPHPWSRLKITYPGSETSVAHKHVLMWLNEPLEETEFVYGIAHIWNCIELIKKLSNEYYKLICELRSYTAWVAIIVDVPIGAVVVNFWIACHFSRPESPLRQIFGRRC